MTIDQIEKVETPYFIKTHTPKSPSKIYLNFNEIGVDEEGALYVDPQLEMTGMLVISKSYNKEAAKKNPFYYFSKPKKPWPELQEWHKVADAKNIDKVEVFNENKHFQQFIMRIFGDRK